MAVRTNATDVKAITGSTLIDATVDLFIVTANIMINKAVTDGCAVTDETVLTEAEKYLAAHLMTTSGVGATAGGLIASKERFENYTVEYAMSTVMGDGVNATMYGKTANMLMGGCLSDLTTAKASIGFFG